MVSVPQAINLGFKNYFKFNGRATMGRNATWEISDNADTVYKSLQIRFHQINWGRVSLQLDTRNTKQLKWQDFAVVFQLPTHCRNQIKLPANARGLNSMSPGRALSLDSSGLKYTMPFVSDSHIQRQSSVRGEQWQILRPLIRPIMSS